MTFDCKVCDGGPNGHTLSCPVLNIKGDVLEGHVMNKIDMDEVKRLLSVYRRAAKSTEYGIQEFREVSDESFDKLLDIEMKAKDAILNHVGKTNV